MCSQGLSEDRILHCLDNSDISDLSSDEDDWVPTTSTSVSLALGDESVTEDNDANNVEVEEEVMSEPVRPTGRRLIYKRQKFAAKAHPACKDYHTIQNPPEIRTPLQYFTEYFSEQLYERGAEFTNLYSVLKKGKSLGTTIVELKKFFGMNLIMGCIPFPRLRMYWQKGINLFLVSECMSRDSFLALRINLHFVDIQPPPDVGNKLWKVQPVIDAVRVQCEKLPRAHGYYSIDEQMIPFTGRCVLKQYVKNKPRPVGLKNFVLCSSNGMVLDFEIYQADTTPLPDRHLGLGPAFVMRLVRTLTQGSFVYFDRYFTTLPLLETLGQNGIEATGSIMVNRMKDVKLKEGKMQRGECHEYVRSDDAIVVVEWKDTQRVVVASTCAGIEPLAKVRRWCKKEHKYIEVDCPFLIKNYNENMGGVDICNQQLECYRTWFRTKKWTLKMILHFLDISIVNSWLQYREDCRENKCPRSTILDLLNFRMAVGQALIATPDRERREEDEDEEAEAQPTRKKTSIYTPSARPVYEKRYDGYDHWPSVDDIASPRSCQYEACKSRTRSRCLNCDLYLCISKDKNCFRLFHIR